jgi:hypothetical protein
VGLTNRRSWLTTVAFAGKLRLSPDTSYIAFDFWERKLLGLFEGQMDVLIEPHDTWVSSISYSTALGSREHRGTSPAPIRLKTRLGMARGADDGVSSETLPGEAYTLWFYIPKGKAPLRVHAATKSDAVVQVDQESSGNSLKVTFPGQPEAVDWEVGFAGQSSQ